MSDFKAKMHQIQFRLELRPDPAGGAYNTSPDFLAGLKGPLPMGAEGKGRSGGRGRVLLLFFCGSTPMVIDMWGYITPVRITGVLVMFC